MSTLAGTEAGGLLAGLGVGGFRDGDSDVSQSPYNHGVALDNQGRLLVTDCLNNRIRAVWAGPRPPWLAPAFVVMRMGPSQQRASQLRRVSSPRRTDPPMWQSATRFVSSDGIVTTIAGSGQNGHVDGPGDDARLNRLHGMALTASSMLVFCDCDNNLLRRLVVQLDPNNGHVTTIVFICHRPRGVVHSSDGTLYVAAHTKLRWWRRHTPLSMRLCELSCTSPTHLARCGRSVGAASGQIEYILRRPLSLCVPLGTHTASSQTDRAPIELHPSR